MNSDSSTLTLRDRWWESQFRNLPINIFWADQLLFEFHWWTITFKRIADCAAFRSLWVILRVGFIISNPIYSSARSICILSVCRNMPLLYFFSILLRFFRIACLDLFAWRSAWVSKVLLHDFKPLLNNSLWRAWPIGKFQFCDLYPCLKNHLLIVRAFASAHKKIAFVVL